MKSYLFKIISVTDDFKSHQVHERYVSANSRTEAFGILAIQLVNSGIKVVEVRAITPGTGNLVSPSDYTRV